MNFFDLHCDTLYKAVKENEKIYDNIYDVSIERGEKFNTWIECMAIWIPDDMDKKYVFKHIEKANDLIEKQIKEFNVKSVKKVEKVKEFKDIKRIKEKNKIGIIFTVEGLRGVIKDLKDIKKLSDMNVKIMTLTWNKENEIGTGCLSDKKHGITEFGQKVILEMEKNKIVVDISHASERLFYDVAKISTKPFIATHSNSKKICDVPRNLNDEQFKLICKRKGIVGLNFVPEFIKSKGEINRLDIVKHCEHFLSLGGENHISIGTDFDGAEMSPALKSIEVIYPLYNDFLKLNYSENILQKIFFDNAYIFCQNYDVI